MASFSQLPNEMIAETWRHVLEPEDIESFALVSKHIYAVGSPFIMEHNKLKREFSFFETGPDTRASAPAYLLKNVLLRPRVALYVTHLSIGRHQGGWHGSGYDDVKYSNNWPMTRHDPYPDDEMALFIKAIRKTSFISRDEVERWIRYVNAGDEDEILALLSLFLPNLTTITLNSEGKNPETFRKTIQRIALDGQQSFLTRLKTVYLQSEPSYRNNYLELVWCKAFYNLPLLHALHVRDIGVWKNPVYPKTMFQVLESIKALKEFSYVEPGTETYEVDPVWIRAALLAHAKHSLESLTMTSCRIEGKILVAFPHFTALRELETNIHLLILGTRFEKLPDLLPASIEQLHLHMEGHRCCDSVPFLVTSFVQEKSRRLHNLRALKLSWETEMGVTQANKDLIETLKETCRDIETELTGTAG